MTELIFLRELLIWLSLSDKNHDPKLYLHTENSLGQTVMNLY